uniref:WD repeat-containing protein 37 n=1 Tax=Timema californicum TaxID=61474 RepID=A0A7R9P582_TIMCA|nr:unnamed protein product [Timema californicum]
MGNHLGKETFSRTNWDLNPISLSSAIYSHCNGVVDFISNLTIIAIILLAVSSSSQKVKTAHKLKAQTSKIVSSFKGPTVSCSLVREFTGHKDGIWEVNVARPGQPIIGTASADHTACIWSIETGRCLLQYQGHTGSVNSIRFHPSRDLVLTSSGDQAAHIWQAAVNWDLPKAHSSEEELDTCEKSEDMEVCEGTPNLRTPLCELVGHNGVVMAADWLPGGDQVITASWDRTANLFDAETGVTNAFTVRHILLTDNKVSNIARG